MSIALFLLCACLAQAGYAQIVIPPVANAGPDATMVEGSSLVLDGSASINNDPLGNPLLFQWQQISGIAVTIVNNFTAYPTVIAPSPVPVGGTTVTINLTVTDSFLQSSSDTINITITNTNNPPTASAGADQTLAEGSLVTLDGSGSFDPDGDPLTYAWVQLQGTAVALSDPTVVGPTFVAPTNGNETLIFGLTVDDGLATSAEDTVAINVQHLNQPPVANAGSDITQNATTLVVLDGTASSDPEGDPLTYHWTQLSGPPVSLDLTNPAQPSFVYNGAAILEFGLVVNDGVLDSAPDVVMVSLLQDSSAPDCSGAFVHHDKLWPPNHKMKRVSIKGIAAEVSGSNRHGDSGDDEEGDRGDEDDRDNRYVSVSIDQITQDEPTVGLGRGDTGPDAAVVVKEKETDQGVKVKSKVLLRRERDRDGNGRVYTIHFTATNLSTGASCAGAVQVCVPVKKHGECVDDGQTYDSFQ